MSILGASGDRLALVFFSEDDQLMLHCKSGNDWFVNNKQRCRCNNSVVLLRNTLDMDKFYKYMDIIKANRTGEPGIFLTNDLDTSSNPCCEISLNPFQFCNLTEINCSNIESQEDLNERCKCASFIGTLQATYTDFPYIRKIWKEQTEKEALLGVSLTGIASLSKEYNFEEATEIVKETNKYWAKILNINPASRLTCIKPAGTTSCVFGCSSGIHQYFSNYYIRRLRICKNEPIYKYLIKTTPELLEDDVMYPQMNGVLSIPIKAPDNAITKKDENVINFLEKIKRFYKDWVLNGHISGLNTHNISATVSIYEKDFEATCIWMWLNRMSYNGLTLLFEDDNVYDQLPFEKCSKEKYEELIKYASKINVNKIEERYGDERKNDLEPACSGGNCEIISL